MRSTCVALLVLVPSLASAGNALDKAPFTASPAELLSEAKKAPPSDSGAVVLREDDEITLDDKQMGVHRTRFVVAITSQDGIGDWEGIWREWRPWQQAAPAIRARVISPSGRATDIDTSKLVETPNQTGQMRHVALQLPPLEVGAVIEEELTQRDTSPYPGGRAMSVVYYNNPTVSARVTITAPTALKAHVYVHALAAGRHSVAGARETWTYAFDHLRIPRFDPQVPEDQAEVPELGVATSTWAEAAKAYSAAITPALVFPQPAELPRGDTREVAAAVTAWLHKHVRYVGDALYESPFDAVRLDTVVQRGTAGTNELAALAVTLLRGAGISADLVLVDRGPAFGSHRDHVTLGTFDHVLVRAHIQGRELWIDPEEPDLPVGQLRAEDQGRPALSIADEKMIHTPAAAAADNTIREVHTFELPEVGNSKATEVSHEGGALEPDQRRWVRDSSPADIRKNLGEYVDREYGGELDSFTTTAVDDLARPFEMTLVVPHAKRAMSHWSNAEIWLYASDTLARIDQHLRDADAAVRTHDLAVLIPHIYEIENRIVVPEGFALPAPVPDRTIPVGAYKITEHRQIDGRTLVVTFKLVADKPRLTPSEVTETARAARDLREEATHIVLEQTGWALVDRGDFKKGLGELERLVAARPRDAERRARYAQALLSAGDGDGARREARKAVEADPKSADAEVVLGYVLSHDLLGRRWAKGFDRAGAKAALTKARALDPHHYGAALELAELLERDQRGWRFEQGAEIRAAADAWRAVVEIEPSDAHRMELARALLWAGDPAAAEAIVRKLPESAERNGLLVSAIAITQGADAAQRAADPAALRAATGGLLLLRQYDLARKLAAAGGTAPGTLPGFYDRVHRDDTPFRPTADPKDVAIQLVLEEMDPYGAIDVAWDKDTANDMRVEARKSMPGHLEGFTMPAFSEIMRANATTTVDGDSAAWRVELSSSAAKASLYLASDGKGPKVIGTPLHLRGVGRHVLRLAGKNDDAATRLLDWVAKDSRDSRFHAVWGPSLARDTAAIRLAGAVLADDPASSLAIASKCLVTTTQAQFACDTLLVDAYTKQKRWGDLATWASTTFAPRAPKGYPAAQEVEGQAFMYLGRFDDAKQVFDDALAKFPDNHAAMFWRAMLQFHDGKRDDAAQQLTALAQRSDATVHDLNQIAWLRVTTNLALPDALAFAKRAAQLEPKAGYVANTLAGVEAETGDLHAAITDLRSSIQLDGRVEPDGADWLVLGRILEQAGLRDDAVAAYRRVPKSDPELFGVDSYSLASARLQALGAKR